MKIYKRNKWKSTKGIWLILQINIINLKMSNTQEPRSFIRVVSERHSNWDVIEVYLEMSFYDYYRNIFCKLEKGLKI